MLVRDWPAMKYRGVSDDLSRGPMPTLDFQKHQVRTFSQYKINIYSPYFENTLAYASNPLSAPPGGAMTRSDVEALVQYAQQYHVTIVPEQEAFGHLHHTLMFDTYSKLAETPEGSVLAPGQPGSMQLIQQWFTEIAPCFPGHSSTSAPMKHSIWAKARRNPRRKGRPRQGLHRLCDPDIQDPPAAAQTDSVLGRHRDERSGRW